MNSERKNEIGADDSSGRVLKIREGATLALEELDQLRSGRRCVLRIRGVGGITAPDSIFFARENRRPSHAQSDRENHRRVSINPTDYIKPPLCSSLLKTVLLIIPLVLCLGGSSVVKGDSDPLSIGVVRPETLDDPTESAQGYLKVYSATDEFNDGGLAYYPHSSYAIYTIDGELFKSVENHISPSDESPELVALPAGSYLVIARSNKQGDVGIRVAIKAGQLTVLDLDLGEGDGQTVTFTRVVAPGGQLIGGSRVQVPVVTSRFYENLHELRNGKCV
jgi:hypothetical protein